MLQKYHNDVVFFVTLQKQLTKALLDSYPNINDFELMLDFPKNGSLIVNGESWAFIKHGLGIKFTRESNHPLLIVDVINNFNKPQKIDAWRFMLFLESMGEDVTEKECKSILDRLVSPGFLEALPIGRGRYIYVA